MRRGVVRRGYAGENTTLAVVATNARLTKVQATRMAQMAHQGMVRTISPVHTTLDGDLVIGLAAGPAEGGIEPEANAVGLAAADAVAEAILRAVKTATSLGGLPAWRDFRT
jgi:L-aminopeptidase/D-esterase-like protein